MLQCSLELQFIGGEYMYSITISNKKYEMPDFYDIHKILKVFDDKREEFPFYLSDKIDDFYKEIFLEKDSEYFEKELYFLQLMIDDCYNYVLDGEGDFMKYYDKKFAAKKDLGLNALKKHKTKLKIAFNPDEIEQKMKESSDDPFDLFYYFSFTSFFLNEFLLEIFVMLSEEFKKDQLSKNDLKLLNSYLMEIFSVDYSEAFKQFEASVKL